MIDPAKYSGRQQTFVKHFFLERYLEKVAYVTLSPQLSWSRFVYVDAYSGPWRAQGDEFEDTSAYIALSRLRKIKEGLARINRDVEFSSLFVEREPRAFEDLKNILARFPEAQPMAIRGDFKDHVDEACRLVGNDAFSLTFVDPTGWNVDLAALAPLLLKRGEVIVNFMYNDINRHLLDNPIPAVRSSFDGLFGGGNWHQEIRDRIDNGMDREDAIVGTFAERLRRAGDYEHVTFTRILWPLADRTYFYLVYGTKHLKGLIEFRKIEGAAAEIQEVVRHDARQKKREDSSRIKDMFGASTDDHDSRDLVVWKAHAIGKARNRLASLAARQRSFPAHQVYGELLELPFVTLAVTNNLLLEERKAGHLSFDLAGRQRLPKEDTMITQVRGWEKC